MNSKALFLSILLTLATTLAYSQHLRKLGSDTFVVMSLSQGKKMNESFLALRDSVRLLGVRYDSVVSKFVVERRVSIDSVSIMTERYNQSKVILDSLQYKFNYNKALIDAREKGWAKDKSTYQFFIFAPYVLLLIINIINL